MTLQDPGYFLLNRTVLYTAPVDEPAPANTVVALDAPAGNWTILGHIADETADGNVVFTRDGGDVTTKGSITKRAIRSVVQPVDTGYDVDVTQFTRGPLALYTGTTGGAVAGVFEVGSGEDGATTETASLIVWEDGTKRVGLYCPRVAWSGRDNIDTASIEDAIRLPLHAGFLDSNTLTTVAGKPLRYKWLSPTLLALS